MSDMSGTNKAVLVFIGVGLTMLPPCTLIGIALIIIALRSGRKSVD